MYIHEEALLFLLKNFDAKGHPDLGRRAAELTERVEAELLKCDELLEGIGTDPLKLRELVAGDPGKALTENPEESPATPPAVDPVPVTGDAPPAEDPIAEQKQA